MSHCRQQIFIDAPPAAVWELLEDIGRHGDWWAGFVEVECDGLETGCIYRQVNIGPFGREEPETFQVEAMEDCETLSIRCLDTGTFVRFALTEARGGTFLDGEAGMEPARIPHRVWDSRRRAALVPRLARGVAGRDGRARRLREGSGGRLGLASGNGRSWTRTRDLVLIRDALGRRRARPIAGTPARF